MLSIVVAHSRNGVIGRDGDLPWHLPTDMRRFRELTSGGTVVMGRKTFESLPDAYRPLPNRRNIVLSTTPDYRVEGCEVFAQLADALDACGESAFVIGGGLTYEQALPHVHRVHATVVDAHVDGDAFFPALPDHEWRLADESERIEENDFGYTFRTYERAN